MEIRHSPYGGSKADRYLNCPGYIQLAATVPPRPSGPAADEGTAAHMLAARCLREKKNTALFIGQKFLVNNKKWPVTVEMAEAVQVYIIAVREALIDAERLGFKPILLVEEPVQINDELCGTLDAAVIVPQIFITTFDLKYGRGVVVEADDNSQGMFYTIPLAEKYRPKECAICIIQPRAPHADGPFRSMLISYPELIEWKNEVLMPGVARTKDPDAPFILGDWCKFCECEAICPAQRDHALALAQDVFRPVSPANPPSAETLTLDDLNRFLTGAPIVEAWFNSLRKYAHELLETGRATSKELGFKLVEGRSNREWKDELQADAILKNMLGKERLTEPKLKSPAQIEKLLTKDEKEAFNGLVDKPPGKSQLVALSDKRPEIRSADTVFQKIGDE